MFHLNEEWVINNMSCVIARLGSHMLAVYGASIGAPNALMVALVEELGYCIDIDVNSPVLLGRIWI